MERRFKTFSLAGGLAVFLLILLEFPQQSFPAHSSESLKDVVEQLGFLSERLNGMPDPPQMDQTLQIPESPEIKKEN